MVKNHEAKLRRYQKANCYLLLVNGYLLFIDSKGFGLSSPD
jgi:hypothetical protein